MTTNTGEATRAPEPWTDERIREAFIDDGGQADFYDPINGAKEQRRIAGEIFDRWLAAHHAALRAVESPAEGNTARDVLAVIEDHRGYLELPRHAWAKIKSLL